MNPTYQLKITLEGIEPPRWRRLLVRSDITLYRLHQFLQIVMEWDNSHLYKFEIEGNRYGKPDEFDDYLKDDSMVKLNQVMNKEGSRFSYVYDFGDNWVHDIIVEKILDSEEGKKYPVCLDGSRACPPEDCGGVWGFADLLEAVHDPNHEEHEERKEWLGADFDTEAFDVDEVNRNLGKL